MSNDLDPAKKSAKGSVTRVLNRQVFYRGDKIMEQDTAAYNAYFIESGSVEIVVKEAGHEVKIATLGRGDIFGEMALIDPSLRSATVRVVDDCTVTVISKDDLEKKLKMIKDPAVQALMRTLIVRLREANKGQLHHYINLAHFQDRVTGMVDKVSDGIEDGKRDAFRDEVMPLLEQLDDILEKYRGGQKPGAKK